MVDTLETASVANFWGRDLTSLGFDPTARRVLRTGL